MEMPSSPFVRAVEQARSARQPYAYRVAPELHRTEARRVPVVIVGAGPVGLALARDLATHEIPVMVLERRQGSSHSSRAVCWSKRTLEIFDRLKVAERMRAKGVVWNVGRVFAGAGEAPLYSFDLLPMKEQKFPAFINLQQYYTEEYLAAEVASVPAVDLRWQHTVSHIEQASDHVRLTVDTPDGPYQLAADYVIAADGSRSPLRTMLGLDFEGRTFEDNFLIVDLRMEAPFPAERRFYFNAPFNEGRTALMHQQPDGVWRLDFQLGWNIDREAALNEANVAAKVRAMLGPDVEFEYEWVSLYTFQCRRMQRFVHERVIFVGDAAHLVSPFGARGANGGIQDSDNLGWKLAHVLKQEAPPSLLDSYDEERGIGADENLLNSTRATDFMTPKSAAARALQAAVLELAADFPFARALVNSGRLSLPCSLAGARLITPDQAEFHTPSLAPGTAAIDAPITRQEAPAWLLNLLGGDFVCLVFGAAPPAADLPPGVRQLVVGIDFVDHLGLVAARYAGQAGTTYLIRPDQHVAARWRRYDSAAITAAWRRSLGHLPEG